MFDYFILFALVLNFICGLYLIAIYDKLGYVIVAICIYGFLESFKKFSNKRKIKKLKEKIVLLVSQIQHITFPWFIRLPEKKPRTWDTWEEF